MFHWKSPHSFSTGFLLMWIILDTAAASNSKCLILYMFSLFYFPNCVGTKLLKEMWLPAASPVLQILSFSLGLSFGLTILKARLKMWVCHPKPPNKVQRWDLSPGFLGFFLNSWLLIDIFQYQKAWTNTHYLMAIRHVIYYISLSEVFTFSFFFIITCLFDIEN